MKPEGVTGKGKAVKRFGEVASVAVGVSVGDVPGDGVGVGKVLHSKSAPVPYPLADIMWEVVPRPIEFVERLPEDVLGVLGVAIYRVDESGGRQVLDTADEAVFQVVPRGSQDSTGGIWAAVQDVPDGIAQ